VAIVIALQALALLLLFRRATAVPTTASKPTAGAVAQGIWTDIVEAGRRAWSDAQRAAASAWRWVARLWPAKSAPLLAVAKRDGAGLSHGGPLLLHEGGARRRGARVDVRLPAVAAPLPNVWGAREPLDITVTAVNEQGRSVPHVTVRLALGGEAQTLTTGAEGRAVTTVALDTLGEYALSVSTVIDGKTVEAEATLRIIDYRAEVERLYEELRALAAARGMVLPPEATPREAEARLRHVADRPALASLIAAFEEAEYSHHPVPRATYETAYLALHALRTSRPEGAAAP
jgi:hypothetical protein